MGIDKIYYYYFMIDYSIIVSSDSQGMYTYQTLRNIKEIINITKQRIEVICLVNKKNRETVRFISKAKDFLENLTILEHEFTEIGIAKNFGAEQSKGKFLLFLDGGEFVSFDIINQFISASNLFPFENTLFVPEVKIYFGKRNAIEENIDSKDPSFTKSVLLFRNPWGKNFLISKVNYNKVRFKKTNVAYKLDPHLLTFFVDCLDKGFRISPIPKTVAFVRILNDGNDEESLILSPNNLFNEKGFKKSKETKEDISLIDNRSFIKRFFSSKFPSLYKELFIIKRELKTIVEKIKYKGDNRNILKKIASSLFPKIYFKLFILKERFLSKTKQTQNFEYPNWLRNNWIKINSIEHTLFPPMGKIEEYKFGINPNFGSYLMEMLSSIPEEIDYLIFCPWLKLGGADKLSLNLVQGLRENFPDKKIGIIITERVNSELLGNLPEDIYFFDFGNNFIDLNYQEREILFLRFLIQVRAKKIVNINSHTLFNLLGKYSKTISFFSDIYIFGFCVYITEEGQTLGFVLDPLPLIFDDIKMVLTDNNFIIQYLCERYGLERKKFITVYQPVDTDKFTPRRIDNKDVIDILWASRIDDQKLPYVLEKIIEKSQNRNYRFHVYGGLAMNYSYDTKNMEKYQNVTLYGPYKNGLQGIPEQSKYDLYLYTSQFDGMPNALLEAMSLGFPVIASDVGGIHEIVRDGETGFLVKEIFNEKEYLRKIDGISNNPLLINKITKNSLTAIKGQHSWAAYIRTLRKIFI